MTLKCHKDATKMSVGETVLNFYRIEEAVFDSATRWCCFIQND